MSWLKTDSLFGIGVSHCDNSTTSHCEAGTMKSEAEWEMMSKTGELLAGVPTG